jgi:hypothetical protein
MRKRITLLIAALMLALTMALSGAAFAVNTCKDFTFTESGPPFGQQEDSCQKGSTETTVTKHGKGDGQGNTDEESVKHTGHGDVVVE